MNISVNGEYLRKDGFYSFGKSVSLTLEPLPKMLANLIAELQYTHTLYVYD
jgi:hypothetical protein